MDEASAQAAQQSARLATAEYELRLAREDNQRLEARPYTCSVPQACSDDLNIMVVIMVSQAASTVSAAAHKCQTCAGAAGERLADAEIAIAASACARPCPSVH